MTVLSVAASAREVKEKWKPVVGHEDLYEVSSLGRIRSWVKSFKDPRMPRYIAGSLTNTGYTEIGLCGKGSRRRKRLLHQIVAEAFIGPYPGRDWQVNHKDGNKQNNRLENLEYLTHGDNVRHAMRTGLMDRYCSRKLTPEQVRHIRMWLSRGVSQYTIGKWFGVSRSTILHIKLGDSWSTVQ